jgi:hypothetical protein
MAGGGGMPDLSSMAGGGGMPDLSSMTGNNMNETSNSESTEKVEEID